MEEKLKISIEEHTWLDLSKSWFIKINGIKSGGEINSLNEAIETAKFLAKQLNGHLEKDIININELI